jgi:probable phosphoglycerate mutase
VPPSCRDAGTTTILLVRHAEVANPRQVLYGRLPRFALSDVGRRQAEALAERLGDCPIAAIYTSPLLRARQTAAAIARRHPEARVRRSALLHEVGSAWRGTPFADFPTGFNTYDARRDPADESLDDIRRRMLRFLELVRRRHPGQRVVAVSHGDPLTILRVALSGRVPSVPAIRGPDYAQLCSITEARFLPGADDPLVTCWPALPNAGAP